MAQIDVRPQIGLTFARAVRGVLRQDPDVILVGAIRDIEVADLAAQSALTGHLVLASVLAQTAPGGLKRLLDMGVEPFAVNASVMGVISQRLVRTLCAECRRQTEPALHMLPPDAAEFAQSLAAKTFYAPKRCEHCHGTGYRGRTAVHEILIPNDRVRQAVATSADAETIREAALASGMRTMLACGLEKAAQGITSVQEVIRVAAHRRNE